MVSAQAKAAAIAIPIVAAAAILLAVSLVSAVDQNAQLPGSVTVAPDRQVIVTYSIGPGHATQAQLDGIRAGLAEWERLNHGLAFAQDQDDPRILFQFGGPKTKDFGWTDCIRSNVISSCPITIFTGEPDCNGTFQPFTKSRTQQTVMHLTGLAMGINHTTKEGHLMYGIDELTEDPFDDKGWQIPEPTYEVWNTYEGQAGAKRAYDEAYAVFERGEPGAAARLDAAADAADCYANIGPGQPTTSVERRAGMLPHVDELPQP